MDAGSHGVADRHAGYRERAGPCQCGAGYHGHAHSQPGARQLQWRSRRLQQLRQWRDQGFYGHYWCTSGLPGRERPERDRYHRLGSYRGLYTGGQRQQLRRDRNTNRRHRHYPNSYRFAHRPHRPHAQHRVFGAHREQLRRGPVVGPQYHHLHHGLRDGSLRGGEQYHGLHPGLRSGLAEPVWHQRRAGH